MADAGKTSRRVECEGGLIWAVTPNRAMLGIVDASYSSGWQEISQPGTESIKLSFSREVISVAIVASLEISLT